MKLFSWTHDEETEESSSEKPAAIPILQSRLDELQKISVKQIMTPRSVVMALDVDVQLRRVRRLKSAKASFFPVYQGDLDHILGWISKSKVLELINEPSDDVQLTHFLRPVGEVSDKAHVGELADLFLKTSSPFLVVRNAQDATVGIVTLNEFVQLVFGFELAEAPVTSVVEPSTIPLRSFEI